MEFQTKFTLSRENQNGIPRSKFDPISSLTCSSFCNLTCLTGSGGKVMGIVRLSSHQATLREVKPNMGIQIMSSNNLWWQDCKNFSYVAFTVELLQLPPPGCQMLHLGVLHEVVTHQCCKEPGSRIKLFCQVLISLSLIIKTNIAVIVNLGLGHKSKPGLGSTMNCFLHLALCFLHLLDCCPAFTESLF